MRRDFQFFGRFDEDAEEFIGHERAEVQQLLLDLEGAIHQLGGVMTMSAVRQQTGDDTYVTTGVLISYDSFSPAARRPKAEEANGEDWIETPDPTAQGPSSDEIPPVEDHI